MSVWPARSTDDDDAFVMLEEDPPDDVSGRRRRTGVMVLALAILAVLVVAAGRGWTVSGAAVVPPPPEVGDCVSLSATDPLWRQMSEDDVPVLLSAPCAGARDGEVVSVDDGRADSQGDCWTPTMGYLGLSTATGQVRETETTWFTRSLVMSYTAGPSPLQVSAGQLWSACVVLGVDTEDFRPQPLTESPRGAATRGGAAFDPFASCSNTPYVHTATPCGVKHRY